METKNIYKALLEAQKKIETITKDATAGKGSFSYNYATLEQVMDMIKKPLNDEGISIIQPISESIVITKLVYIDGTEISDNGTPIVCAKPNDPQAQGSAITYARRYGLMSLLCLSTEDDDGVKAMPSASPKPPEQDKFAEKASVAQVGKINAEIGSKGLDRESIKTKLGIKSFNDLSKRSASDLIEKLIKTESKLPTVTQEVEDIVIPDELPEDLPF